MEVNSQPPLPSEKTAAILHLLRGWVSLRTFLDIMWWENCSTHSWNQPLIVQPAASHFSDCIVMFYEWIFFFFTLCRCVASSSAQNPVLYHGAVVAQLVAFLLALAFMLLYYRYFHPSGTSTTLSKSISITDPNMDLGKPGQSKQFSSQKTL